jgi:transmembrane sensor
MTEMRGPQRPALRQHLREDLDESQVKRMWERIDHAPTRGRRASFSLSMAAAAAATLLLLWLGLFHAGRESEPRQLALLSGGALSVLGNEREPSVSSFDDGSQVRLADGARLEVLRNDGRSFVTALRRGGATFDVKPGGPRHWIIEAGELSVEVVGTRFSVARRGESTKVSVEHGIVQVRGERVPGGVVRLTAGSSFELPVDASSPPSAEPSRAPALLAAPAGERQVGAGSPGAGAAPSAPASSSQPQPQPEPRDEVEAALRAADTARHQADNAGAIRNFDAAWRAAAPGDTRRGLAALSLARLLIAGEPAKAAQILQSSLSDMPGALLEDASVRLVEAESRAGNHEAAAHAADDYLRRFPAGRRAEEVRRWTSP